MPMQWYYVIDGKRYGPVSEEELTQLAEMGTLRKDDLVWNETLEGHWVEAGTVPRLFGMKAEPPPPMPPTEIAPPLPSAPDDLAEERRYGDISVTAPVGRAWQRMKGLLFSPFDMGKWFALGFSAWLATLGQGGASLPTNFGDFGKRMGSPGSQGGIGQITEFFIAYAAVIIAVAAVVIVLSVAVGLVMAWVQARGQFMFLDNVLKNASEIAEPWRRFVRQGNSLFLWRLAFGVACVLLLLAPIAVAIWGVAIPCIRARAFLPATTPVIVGLGLGLVLFGVLAAYVVRFLDDFVVPIMYRDGVGAVEGWRRFAALMTGHAGKFILYGVFHFLLSMLAVAIVAAAILLTCCIAGCLLVIPYIGTVTALPLLVFFRLYSLEYLAQYGPEFDLLRKRD